MKVMILLDYANLAASANSLAASIDYEALHDYLADEAEGREVIVSYAFPNILRELKCTGFCSDSFSRRIRLCLERMHLILRIVWFVLFETGCVTIRALPRLQLFLTLLSTLVSVRKHFVSRFVKPRLILVLVQE